jgi:uncharacterized repeat protein (TIGR03943 family)
VIDARLARSGVLLAWGGFFLVLWITGTANHYVGARTAWIIPVGTIALLVAAALAACQRSASEPLDRRAAAMLLVLLLPLAAVLFVPRAELGAWAASRKGGILLPAVKPAPPASPEDLTLLDIRIAEGDHTFALVSHIHPGLRVRLNGIVSGSHTGTFALTRFYVSCCVADAVPVTVPVEWPNRVQNDQWVRVTGTLQRHHDRFAIIADHVRHSPELLSRSCCPPFGPAERLRASPGRGGVPPPVGSKGRKPCRLRQRLLDLTAARRFGTCRRYSSAKDGGMVRPSRAASCFVESRLTSSGV